MGRADYHGYRKANPLKLGAEHVPFPCSLRELVLDRYGEPPGVGGDEHPMQLDELLEYLKNIDNFSLSPWVALVGQTEAIGDPATPSREQVAILRWLGKALEIWEKQSPLEGRIAAQVRRLKPLSAALALTEPSFLRPGAHPLHQLLDSIQARAIGWQARLDRVGAILEQQVTKAVDESRQWFTNKSTNLAGICAEFSAAAERDQARAQRMIQRVVEAEAGKVKTVAAKQEAARMINAALQKYLAPDEIGAFIKGPWYTSAQLLLLKFGADSEQWQKMSATTETLLDSFQSMEAADDTRRQHIFEVVTQLPKEMRRWLLSLHHDTEAVNEAMGLVEFAHLRILRRQPVELQHVLPIVVEGEHDSADATQNVGAMKKLQEGQWFAVESGDGVVRAQLVLKVEQSQQLLFTNLAGIKVLQLNISEFGRLQSQGKVKPLHSGATFSLCLAHAVGIDSVEILNALASALAESQPLPEPESNAESNAESNTESSGDLAVDAELPTPAESKAKPKAKPKSAAKPDAMSAPKSTQMPELELELAADLTLQMTSAQEAHATNEPVEEIHDQDYWLMSGDDDVEAAVPRALPSVPDDKPGITPSNKSSSTPATKPDSKPDSKPTPDAGQPMNRISTGNSGYLAEQAEQIRARGGYFVSQTAQHDTTRDTGADEAYRQLTNKLASQDFLEESSRFIAADEDILLDLPAYDDTLDRLPYTQAGSIDALPDTVSDPAEPVPAREPEAYLESDGRGTKPAQDALQSSINLPMGAWLGFHDGDTPLMARLAVYDLENDYYIFVNRKGVKMRQVSRLALFDLIDNGLVDILETNSNFRDEVTEVRKKLDQ